MNRDGTLVCMFDCQNMFRRLQWPRTMWRDRVIRFRVRKVFREESNLGNTSVWGKHQKCCVWPRFFFYHSSLFSRCFPIQTNSTSINDCKETQHESTTSGIQTKQTVNESVTPIQRHKCDRLSFLWSHYRRCRIAHWVGSSIIPLTHWINSWHLKSLETSGHWSH